MNVKENIEIRDDYYKVQESEDDKLRSRNRVAVFELSDNDGENFTTLFNLN